jgi:spore coat polysaccharide biosynthesis protein SpsF (cytidylyltransferase family)
MSGTVAIIQARMGSTRLPRKVMRDIGDRPMLSHVHERTAHASTIDTVVVATSSEPGDDEIADYCNQQDIWCHRGSESDVLDRYYQAATEVGAETVVRITADCPFLSPAVVDHVVRRYEDSSAPYVTNILEYTYPDGLDVEAFDIRTLERAWEEASNTEHREHVTPWIRESEELECLNVENPIDLWQYEFPEPGTIPRWTVDYPEDMEFVRSVYEGLTQRGHWVFGQQSVLELLERRPSLPEINGGL